MNLINELDKNLAINELNKIIEENNWISNFSFFYNQIENRFEFFVEHKKNKFINLYFDLNNKMFLFFDDIDYDYTLQNYEFSLLVNEKSLNKLVFNIENYSDFYFSSSTKLIDFEFYSDNPDLGFINNKLYLDIISEIRKIENDDFYYSDFIAIKTILNDNPIKYITSKLMAYKFLKLNEDLFSYKYHILSFLLNPVSESNVINVFYEIAKYFYRINNLKKSAVFLNMIKAKILEIFLRENLNILDIPTLQTDCFELDYFGNENPRELLSVLNNVELLILNIKHKSIESIDEF